MTAPLDDFKARRYVTERCRRIPDLDENAIYEHARALYHYSMSAGWVTEHLIKMCRNHWISDNMEAFIRRHVDEGFTVESMMGPPGRGRMIAPTPLAWVKPARLPQREWLYKPIYVRKFISLTAATGGTGKTSLALVENAAMVTGRDLLGVAPGEDNLRCWMWNGEDPFDEMQRRWFAVCKHYGITKDEISGRFFMDSGRDMPIKVATLSDGRSTIADPVVDDLIYAIKENQIDVLTIDPFVSCHAVTENDTSMMQSVVESFANIANECNCHIGLLHHTRKTGGADASIEDARGASAAVAAARGRRVLNKMTRQEAEAAGVGPNDRGRYFWADCSLSSMAPPAEHRDWYRLESVNLGNGECGDGDSVGVAVAWEHPGTALDLDDDQQEAVLAAIQDGGPWRENHQAEDWIGVPIAQALGLHPANKTHRKQVRALINEWLDQGRLKISEEKDPKQRRAKKYICVT